MPLASTASTATAAAGGELELQRSRDIKKNLIHCAELKKHNTRFYSEVLRKKFFVLYEDSRRSVTNPRDHTANAGSNEDQRPSDVSIPQWAILPSFFHIYILPIPIHFAY